MRLMYLEQAAINDLKVNFQSYKNHFCDKTNEWFMKKFEEEGWIKESKIECEDFTLSYDEDFNISDRKNIKILYNALKNLNPANAVDERLWAGMLFGQLWEFVQYRRFKELRSKDKKDILNSFFFMRGQKRSCFMNCLSRLWWAGYLFYDPSSSSHYKAIDLITESAFASKIIILSSNNFMANKDLALGVMDSLIAYKEKGKKITREYFVNVNKYLNRLGGTIILDTMTREEVKVLIDKQLDELDDTK